MLVFKLQGSNEGKDIGFDDCPECGDRHIIEFSQEVPPDKLPHSRYTFEPGLSPFYFMCPVTRNKVCFSLIAKILTPGKVA